MNGNQVGEITYSATIDTGQLKSDAKQAEKIVGDVGDSAESAGQRGETSFVKMGVALGAVAGVASAVVSKGINLVTDSISSAIKRVDTLNNANRTFSNMGFAAGDTAKAMDALKDSILGLPTPLDQAVQGMQLIAGSTNDIGKSQKIFTAINNAILGFGGTANDVQGAVIQLSQAFSNGKIDAQTWNSLIQSGLGPALNALARQMGITTGALKDGLSDGSISVGVFQDALVKMNKEGGGGLKSFEQISKDATSGIGTGWQNLQTAITRGISKIIESIGSKNISDSITNLGTALEGAFKWIADNKETIIAALKGIGAGLAFILALNMAQAIATTVAQIGSLISVFNIFITSLKAGATVMEAFNVIAAANPIGLIVIAVALVIAALVFLQVKFDIFGKAVRGLQTAFKAVLDWVKSNWDKLLVILLGPIGLFIALFIKNFDTIKQTVMSVLSAIGSAFVTAWQAIVGVVQFFVNIIVGIFNIFATVFYYIFAVIRGLFEVAWGYIYSNIVAPVFAQIVSLWQSLVGVVETVWSTITGILAVVFGWISNTWNAIIGGIAAGWNWLYNNVIGPVISSIKGAFNSLFGFVSDIFNRLVSIGSGVGSAISGAFSAAFEGLKNILKSAVNWMIDQVNKVVHAVNGSAGKLPGVPNIPDIPRLADGGIVPATPGGRLAILGEAGQDEAVIPLNKLNGAGGGRTLNIGTINIASDVDGERWIKRLSRELEIEELGMVGG